jgi:hypothetical protein
MVATGKENIHVFQDGMERICNGRKQNSKKWLIWVSNTNRTMKKNIHLILGIIGLGLVAYSLMEAWTAKVPTWGAYPPTEQPGYTHWQGLMAGGLAVVAVALIFMRNRLAVMPAILVVGMALYVMFAPKGAAIQIQFGIYIAMAGGALLALGGLFAGRKK